MRPLHAAGLPVAKVPADEADPDLLGQALFIIMQFVEGTCSQPAGPVEPPSRTP